MSQLAELRWILLGLGTLAIGVIWWWSTRRSTQAPGNAELRESSVVPVPTLAPTPTDAPRPEKHQPEKSAADRPTVERAQWSVSPLEPLSIRTADFDTLPELDEPMMAQVDPLEVTVDLAAIRATAPRNAPREPAATTVAAVSTPAASMPAASPPAVSMPAVSMAAATLTPAPPAAPPANVSAARIPTLAPPSGATGGAQRPLLNPENSDRLDAVAPANSSEKQKIVALRVCSVGERRWPGAALMSSLEMHGLAFGRYQVYHRKHADGRSIFCVASLAEPGTFDPAQMPNEQYRGVSMFAVLPGPLEPLQTVDALFATARELAKELNGTVQDAKGIPFSPQRVAALREDVARFQAQLS